MLRKLASGFRLVRGRSRALADVFGETARIFPLSLSPFERFMLLEDRPSHPMMFVLEIDFQGEMQRPAFEEALSAALAAHPMLQAVVRPMKAKRLCWVHVPQQRRLLDWADSSQPIVPQPPIDIRSEPGLRMWVRVGAGRTRWVLQFHHGCCDGIGGYRFAGDVLCGYGQRTAHGGEAPEAAETEPKLLRTRIARMRFSHDRDQQVRGPLSAIHYALKNLLFVRSAPIAAPQPAPQSGGPGNEFGILWQSLSAAEFRALRDAAATCGGSYNDLLLAELLRTICRWNERHRARGRRPINILVPVDLRGQGDEAIPAANMAGYTFFSRRSRACADRVALLRSVVAESLRIRYGGAGLAFVEALTWGFSVRGLMPWLLSGSPCLASAVFTNPGDPSKRFRGRFPRKAGVVVCGDLTIERFLGTPPLGPKIHLAMATSPYRRQLTVCICCDPTVFDAAGAAEFMECYLRGLRSWTDAGTSAESVAGPVAAGSEPIG